MSIPKQDRLILKKKELQEMQVSLDKRMNELDQKLANAKPPRFHDLLPNIDEQLGDHVM